MSYRILQLFPELTDINGDAQNALVLTRRLQWAGHEADTVALAAGASPPVGVTPAAVVLGSGVDSALERTRDALLVLRPLLDEWLAAGVPLLAVGTGMELLGRTVPLEAGALEGLGIVRGSATVLPARVTADLVAESNFGPLVGYENHARGFSLDDPAERLARVITGTGNGAGTEGIRTGSVFGTHLHGPVLARNPALADALIAAAGIPVSSSDQSRRVDALAEGIATRVRRGGQ